MHYIKFPECVLSIKFKSTLPSSADSKAYNSINCQTTRAPAAPPVAPPVEFNIPHLEGQTLCTRVGGWATMTVIVAFCTMNEVHCLPSDCLTPKFHQSGGIVK